MVLFGFCLAYLHSQIIDNISLGAFSNKIHNNKKVSNRALAETDLPGQKALLFLFVGAHVYWDLVKSS